MPALATGRWQINLLYKKKRSAKYLIILGYNNKIIGIDDDDVFSIELPRPTQKGYAMRLMYVCTVRMRKLVFYLGNSILHLVSH